MLHIIEPTTSAPFRDITNALTQRGDESNHLFGFSIKSAQNAPERCGRGGFESDFDNIFLFIISLLKLK